MKPARVLPDRKKNIRIEGIKKNPTTFLFWFVLFLPIDVTYEKLVKSLALIGVASLRIILFRIPSVTPSWLIRASSTRASKRRTTSSKKSTRWSTAQPCWQPLLDVFQIVDDHNFQLLWRVITAPRCHEVRVPVVSCTGNEEDTCLLCQRKFKRQYNGTLDESTNKPVQWQEATQVRDNLQRQRWEDTICKKIKVGIPQYIFCDSVIVSHRYCLLIFERKSLLKLVIASCHLWICALSRNEISTNIFFFFFFCFLEIYVFYCALLIRLTLYSRNRVTCTWTN